MTMPVQPRTFRLETPCLVEPADIGSNDPLVCEWCQASLGEVHTPTCFRPEKLVVLDFVVQMVVSVPRVSTPAQWEQWYVEQGAGEFPWLLEDAEAMAVAFDDHGPAPGEPILYGPIVEAVRYVRDAGPDAERAVLAMSEGDTPDSGRRPR